MKKILTAVTILASSGSIFAAEANEHPQWFHIRGTALAERFVFANSKPDSFDNSLHIGFRESIHNGEYKIEANARRLAGASGAANSFMFEIKRDTDRKILTIDLPDYIKQDEESQRILLDHLNSLRLTQTTVQNFDQDNWQNITILFPPTTQNSIIAQYISGFCLRLLARDVDQFEKWNKELHDDKKWQRALSQLSQLDGSSRAN